VPSLSFLERTAYRDIVSTVQVRYITHVLFKFLASLFLVALILSGVCDQLQAANSQVSISKSQSISPSPSCDSSDDVRLHLWRPTLLQAGGLRVSVTADPVKALVPITPPVPYDVSEAFLLHSVLLL